MKYLITLITGLLLMTLPLIAQDEAPDVPEPPETEEPGEGETEEALGKNLSEQQKITRLAEASGKTEADILAMRNGTVLTPPEGTETLEGETEGGKKMGWGQIAHALGLHPGILGKGTGDKFMPELPEVDGEAIEAAKTARERAMERKAKRREAKADSKQSRRDAKAEKIRGKSKQNKGKPENPGNSQKPEKAEKSNNGKGNK